MDKRRLAEIERRNNTGQVSPQDVAALIARVRLLESVLQDRTRDDYNRANGQRGANGFGRRRN